jgi:hypothetical protein
MSLFLQVSKVAAADIKHKTFKVGNHYATVMLADAMNMAQTYTPAAGEQPGITHTMMLLQKYYERKMSSDRS